MPRDLAELFGVTRDGVRWERPALIAAALFGARLFMALMPGVSFHSTVGEPGGRIVWNWPAGAEPGWLVLDLILAAVEATVPFLGFLVVRRAWVVIPVAALVRAVVAQIGLWALFTLMGHGYGGSATPLLATMAKRSALGFVGQAAWLTCLALALVLIRSRSGAVFAGVIGGGALSFWWWRLGSRLLLPGDSTTGLTYMLLSFAESLVWDAVTATFLWAGLRVTSAGEPAAPRVKPRASRSFYAGTAFATALVGELAAAVILVQTARGRWEAAPYIGSSERTLSAISLGILVLCLVGIMAWLVTITAVLVYKAWAAVQDEHASVSPGWAVGGLFIPLFNVYWLFRVWAGFPGAWNAFAARVNLSPRLRPGLFVTFCVLALLSFVPFAGSLLGLANVFVRAIAMGQICDAINTVPHRPTSLRAS